MGVSEKEFLRLLPKVLGANLFYIMNDKVTYENNGKTAEFFFVPEKSIEFGSLKIPKLGVRIILYGFDEREYQDFVIKFERAYQKGGG